ncbi:MAG TPA: LPS assembly lipoprotein LptE [Bacteroidales bacterium]|nr:LPS assembly lipoprotein LptE [Bacteroidales bacterium]
MTVISCFRMSYSTTGASIPAAAKTYSVQYIENQANIVEPGLSQLVTDALKDYIQSNSNLIYVNQNGDVDFEAVITAYDPSTPATVVAGDVAAQNKFTISMKVKFTCNVDPELDFESSFSRYKLYNVEGEGFERVKDDYTTEIVNLILEDIYKRAFVNW